MGRALLDSRYSAVIELVKAPIARLVRGSRGDFGQRAAEESFAGFPRRKPARAYRLNDVEAVEERRPTAS